MCGQPPIPVSHDEVLGRPGSQTYIWWQEVELCRGGLYWKSFQTYRLRTVVMYPEMWIFMHVHVYDVMQGKTFFIVPGIIWHKAELAPHIVCKHLYNMYKSLILIKLWWRQLVSKHSWIHDELPTFVANNLVR